ncbi:MAG TPA: hypothetical protein VH877_12440 [Polyangia bacterium]|jgi:hypothetical protein|nr:hypothetical protein [Polyangia bacterium]
MGRIFLLSPAQCGGLRAEQLLSPRATSPLARQLQSRAGATIGEVFTYLSALYFRGKLTYARAFARPPDAIAPAGGVLVITPAAGLLPVDAPLDAAGLRAFGRTEIELTNPAYRQPLEASARTLRELASGCEVVLLGSIATPKYVEPLLAVFGADLFFPPAFVGRGDMSRGGLCLRCAREGVELEYAPVAGAVRTGPRPPRLPKRPRPIDEIVPPMGDRGR